MAKQIRYLYVKLTCPCFKDFIDQVETQLHFLKHSHPLLHSGPQNTTQTNIHACVLLFDV